MKPNEKQQLLSMVSAGIFGPKLSGKTTLAKKISLFYWRECQQRTLCLDINMEKWGDHCLVIEDEEKFWSMVWQTKDCLIIVDEASSTINRDKSFIPVFTRLRHLRHRLVVIGHSGTNLLPAMREQLDTLFLFRQPEKAAEIWANTFTEKGLLQATELKQYEYIFCRLYCAPRIFKQKQ